MPIEFACQCGARFRVADDMAGKRARCKDCRQTVIIPSGHVATVQQSPTVPAPPILIPPPRQPGVYAPVIPPIATDERMEREIEWHQEVTQSAASKPGRLRISHFKHWMSFPFWPTLWAGLVLLSVLYAMLVHWAFVLLALLPAGLLWMYWWIQRAKFVSGCTNPAMVVSLHPPLVATYTDLSMGQTDSKWHYVKVVSQPLDTMTGDAPHVGQRLATIATYRQGDNTLHWSNFSPVVVNCVTWDMDDVTRVFSTLDAVNWHELDQAIRQIPQPYAAGLYKVELDPPSQKSSISSATIASRLASYLPHGNDKRCWVTPSGVPLYLLQSAKATIGGGAPAGEALGLLLAPGDSKIESGLLFTSAAVYYRFSGGPSGMFRWLDIAGAGNAADGFEVLLTSGVRLRWGTRLGKLANEVEAVLESIAKMT
jgi:hypothetical protein